MGEPEFGMEGEELHRARGQGELSTEDKEMTKARTAGFRKPALHESKARWISGIKKRIKIY